MTQRFAQEKTGGTRSSPDQPPLLLLQHFPSPPYFKHPVCGPLTPCVLILRVPGPHPQHSLDKGRPQGFRFRWKQVEEITLGSSCGDSTWEPDIQGALALPPVGTGRSQGEKEHSRQRLTAGNGLNSQVLLGSGRPFVLSPIGLQNCLLVPLRGRLPQGVEEGRLYFL